MPYRAPTHSEEQGRRGYDQAYSQQGKWVEEKKVYASPRWKMLRQRILREQPLCADPYGWHAVDQRLVVSSQIDHKIPLRVDRGLAYTRSNLQGLCAWCHRVKTQEDLRRWPLARRKDLTGAGSRVP